MEPQGTFLAFFFRNRNAMVSVKMQMRIYLLDVWWGYGCDDQEIVLRFQETERYFTCFQISQKAKGQHSNSYSIGMGGYFFLRSKRSRRTGEHSPPSRTKINPLAPNDVYIRRTAQLTSRRCILNIYSTNILTEYFKHAAHSPFFLSSSCRLFHNATFFGYCNINILYTGCAKI